MIYITDEDIDVLTEAELKKMVNELSRSNVVDSVWKRWAKQQLNNYEFYNRENRAKLSKSIKDKYDIYRSSENTRKKTVKTVDYRKSLNRTLARMVKAGMISSLEKENVLSKYDNGDKQVKSGILSHYFIDSAGHYIGPHIPRSSGESGIDKYDIHEESSEPVILETAVESVVDSEEIYIPIEERINRFAEVCNDTFGKSGPRHSDIRGMTSGFYIMRDGLPLSVGKDETPGEVYANIVSRSPDANVVLVCNVFPRSEHRSDERYLKKRYVEEILHSAKMADIPISEDDIESLDRITKEYIKKNFMIEYPDYVRIMYKPDLDTEKGLLWVEAASYRSTEVPEPKQGVKAMDLFRVEFENSELDPKKETVYGYSIPYSEKIHRYPMDSLCMRDDDLKVCVTDKATIVVKKGGLIW